MLTLEGVPNILTTWSLVVLPGWICVISSGGGRFPRCSIVVEQAESVAPAAIATSRDEIRKAGMARQRDEELRGPAAVEIGRDRAQFRPAASAETRRLSTLPASAARAPC